jgi:hypothetical protein
MPDWTYVPLEPIASRAIGAGRAHRLALGVLATLVRAGGRWWIPVVFAHPEVPSELTGRLGALVPVGVARDAIDVLPVQGATIVQVGPVTSDDVPTVAAAARGRRCRVEAICDSEATAHSVAPHVDATHVRTGGERIVVSEPDVDAVVETLSRDGTSVVVEPGVLVATGPGYFHRVIEAWNARSALPPSEIRRPTRREIVAVASWPAWMWALLVGIGLIVAGIGAAAITVGPVLLGYDRDYLGLTVAGLDAIDPHLVGFLQHDRITMAGNMIGIGILYCGLACGGIRRGRGWARTTLLISGVVAFGTWFYFLATGFVEPLHTTVVVILFPALMIAVIRAPVTPPARVVGDGPQRERARALWAQLLMIGVGGGLTVAGVVISTVGLTAVFVPTDLGYLGTDSATLSAADQQLLPFIAHDRAGFGGALVGAGLAVLLISLWGWRRGERWVWWALAGGCLSGTAPALVVHLEIGYTTFSHLLPLYVLVAVVAVALTLARPFLTATDVATDPEVSPAAGRSTTRSS